MIEFYSQKYFHTKTCVRARYNCSLTNKNFNYKKANWERLNTRLREIDWKSALESLHPDTAWNIFTDILRNGMDLCIPKIKIRSDFQPIGYDSECHRKCKEKERCHKRYKATASLQDGLKFASVCKEFRRLVCKKMRDNLYNYEDANLISKNFGPMLSAHQNLTEYLKS